MKTKQTTIDWLLNEWPILKSELPHWLIEQAKEIEKQQIIDACWAGGDDGERYYDETYGGNK